ncbi:MAG: 1-acyl-sn-glycerol-3-phosphate acyltransferase [Pseudomonadales bacterium]|nr:1-acyl-sn-glycerol-3-phosphate acyltransferase [Pseudomonadales bacterium]
MHTTQQAPRCNTLAHWLGKTIIKLTGWRVGGELPDNKSMIILAAPHTSNWDLFFLLGAAYSFRLSIKFLIKDNLFVPVVGSVLSFLGGIPVNRSKNVNLVDTLANRFTTAESGLALVIPPAGTRSYTEYWKSGFYHIAQAAQIPIVCGYLDYAQKEAGLGPVFYLSGDLEKDMDKIRGFYADKKGKYPEKSSRILLKEEQL